MRRAESAVKGPTWLVGTLVLVCGASAHAGAVIPPLQTASLPRAIAPIADGVTPLTRWGRSMATDGQRVIVGAQAGNTGMSIQQFNPGVTEIHEYSPAPVAGWRRVADLLPAAGLAMNDMFGQAVAIEGDIAVVGAPQRMVGGFVNAGAAYVFHRQPDGTWIDVQTLTETAPHSNDRFAMSLALQGGRLVVGAPGRSNGGGASVFDADANGMFGAETTLSVPSSIGADDWGTQVGIDGALIVLSNPFEKVITRSGTFTQAGAVASFTNGRGAPTFDAKFTAPASGIATSAEFGNWLAFGHGILAVASPGFNGLRGAVYCYRRAANSWNLVGTVSGTQTSEWLGRVAVGENLMTVGSPFANGSGGNDAPGTVALYRVDDASITLLAQRVGEAFSSSLGFGVTIANDWWFVREELDGLIEAPIIRGVHLGDAGGDCDGNGIPNAIEVTVNGAPDCDQNLVPDSCELAAHDCDLSGTLDACDVATIDVASSSTAPGSTLLYVNQSESVGILLCRIDVPLNVGQLVSVGSRTVAGGNNAKMPCYVAIYADGDNNGLPDNLQLLDARSTFFPGAPDEFEVPLGPLTVVPGTTIFVALAVASAPVTPTDSTLWLTQSPYVPARTFFTTWPVATLDFAEIGESAVFTELGDVLPLDANVYCFAHFAAPADLNLDGTVDACACPADFSGDGSVGPEDLAQLLGGWTTAVGDLDGDGTTGPSDLAILLGAWGSC